MPGERSRKTVLSSKLNRITKIRRRLLAWYDRCHRDLPWRRRQSDGYAQLLAELMLQQTQAVTVASYYERFLARWPTVQDLAAADLDEVLGLWAGLGYYRRARHLHAAARLIVDEHGGQVPATVEGLMGLPGVGRYTAGAIASVVYGVSAPILDGNVTRVLARIDTIHEDVRAPAARSRLWALAEALVPRRRPGDFNQALMELGATVCTPRSPHCQECPLERLCLARQAGIEHQLPIVGRRVAVREADILVAAVRQGQSLLFMQRPATGLWAGLWELPSEPVQTGEPLETARRRLRERLPFGSRLRSAVAGQVTRQLTHRRIIFHIHTGYTPRGSPADRDGQPGRWVVTDEWRKLGISRACEAILQFLGR